jgi:hypothetical protein
MNSVPLPVLRLSLCALVLGGCSSAPESSREDRGFASSLAPACDPSSVATLQEVAIDHATGSRMAKVDVCVTPTDGSAAESCALTSATGSVAFSIPRCRDYRVTFTQVGYLGANQLLRIVGDAGTGARMLSTQVASQFARALGTRLDLTKAQPAAISYDMLGDGLAGLSLSLTPASGMPWYLDSSGAPSGSLTVTTPAGIGGFFNADPGTYVMHADVPAGPNVCNSAMYVPGDAPRSVKIEAIAGSIAIARFDCF